MTDTFPLESRGLTSDELKRIETDTLELLTGMIGKLSQEDWRQGLAWYHDAHSMALEWSANSGLPFDYVAGIMAALSPRVSWANNVQDTANVIGHGHKGKTMALLANVNKALDIREGYDPDEILGGRKVRSFWLNIAYPHKSLDVTLDSHMAKVVGLPSVKWLERKGVYDALANAFRTLAEKHGIMPHQLQAALWIQARGNAN